MPALFPSRRDRALVGGSLRFEWAQAQAIIEVLIAECGLGDNPYARDSLEAFLTEATPSPEYRFGGWLGDGGKLYNANGGKLWVSCYREDETPTRVAAIGRANARLDALLAGWGLARPW